MTRTISRRAALLQLSSIAALLLAPGAALGQARPRLIVYKDPTCGCCEKWIAHMTANGFAPTVTDTDMAAIKRLHRIPESLQSCHTTLVGGYVIEGHVPAADVRKLLATRPKGVRGLTIPGMPASAPGMDVKPFVPYTVLAFDDANRTTVFAKHDRA